MIRTLGLVFTVPLAAHAQAANTPEMHSLAVATFSLACIAPAPDLAASETAMEDAGLQKQANGVYSGFGGQVIGILTSRNEDKTRTCAVGLVLGTAEPLVAAMADLAAAHWQDEAQVMINPAAPPLFIKPNDGWTSSMTLALNDPNLPLMNHISHAPEGFVE